MTILAITAVVVVIGITLAIWLIPTWQARRWRSAGVTDAEKLARLTLEARGSITQAFGGLALVVTLAITAYQVSETRRTSENTLRLSERSQLSQRFSQAVDQLDATGIRGLPATDVRTGALFSLRTLGLDSKDFADSAFFTVATYVMNNYRRSKKQSPGCDRAQFDRPSPEVETALKFVLPALSSPLLADAGVRGIAGLEGAVLNGLGIDRLTFQGFDLSGVELQDAFLNQVDFRRSTFIGADFTGACLQKGHFEGVRLRDAILERADLRNAYLERARLLDANLEGADLRRARFNRAILKRANLTDAKLEGAIFTNADMEGAKLSKSTLADAHLSPEQLQVIVRVS